MPHHDEERGAELRPHVHRRHVLDEERDAHGRVAHAEVGVEHLHVPSDLWHSHHLQVLVEAGVDGGQDVGVDEGREDRQGLPGAVWFGSDLVGI